MVKILLNAGHSVGSDSGAISTVPLAISAWGYEVYTEAAVMYELAQLVELHYAAMFGTAAVQFTRYSSYNLCGDAEEEVFGRAVTDVANMDDDGKPCDLVISLHMNAAADAYAHGVEALVYDAELTPAAARLGKMMVDALASRFAVRGVKGRPDLAILRLTDAPAVLLEVGFITNEDDLRTVVNDRHGIACAIARCIYDFLTTTERGEKSCLAQGN